MNLPPKELLSLSKSIGARVPDWVQGPGGNVSQKKLGQLWIKASGVRLDQIPHPGTMASVPLSITENMKELLERSAKGEDLEMAYSELIKDSSMKGHDLGRASMETGFHLILPREFVLHFHSLEAILFAEKKDTRFSSLKITHIPQTRPGLELTKAIQDAELSDIYILENHGVILHSDTPEILKQWSDFEKFTFTSEIENALDSMKGPFKIYFPDTAVYREELMSLLSTTPDGEYEIKDARSFHQKLLKDKELKRLNLLEIWWATVVLYRTQPGLKEIGLEISSSVASLPTESYRKAKEEQ